MEEEMKKIDVKKIYNVILIVESIFDELWQLEFFGETKMIRKTARSAKRALDRADYFLNVLEKMGKEK